MKKASDIIQSIQLQPQFKKLQDFKCIDKILSSILPTSHKFIVYGFIKNDILFIVVNHNIGKIEIDNNIKTIKDILKLKTPDECLGTNLKDIKTLVTNKPIKKLKLDKKDTTSYYHERAKGEFDVDIFKDEKLKKIALEIKKIIKND